MTLDAPVEREKLDEVAGRLPNLVVIGAMRCGTTTMHAALNAHPEIAMSGHKELSFFVTGRRGNWEKGLEWYASWFSPDVPVRGESSPKYTKAPIHEGVPERMHGLIPDARLIYMVRDPIARLLSDFTVMVGHGWEKRTLRAALADLRDNKYVVPGRYAFQLAQYLPWFPKERILVLPVEELSREPEGAMRLVHEFLGVEPIGPPLSPLTAADRNASRWKGQATGAGRMAERVLGLRGSRLLRRAPGAEGRLFRPIDRPVLDAQTRARLLDVYAEDAAELRRLTRLQLSDWSV